MDEVVHFEIPAAKLDRARKFYTSVFGWKADDMPEMEYVMVRTTESDRKTRMPTRPGAINGGLRRRAASVRAPVITISVDNIDRSMEKLERAGGKRVGRKQRVGDMGWNAYAKDSEGNVIGLWQNSR